MPIAILVLGIASIVLLFIPGIPSIISLGCGIAGIIVYCVFQKKQREEGLAVAKNERTMAKAGFVCSIIGCALCALFLIACVACIGTAALAGGSVLGLTTPFAFMSSVC